MLLYWLSNNSTFAVLLIHCSSNDVKDVFLFFMIALIAKISSLKSFDPISPVFQSFFFSTTLATEIPLFFIAVSFETY